MSSDRRSSCLPAVQQCVGADEVHADGLGPSQLNAVFGRHEVVDEMTITSRGGQDFGDGQADIPEYLRDYSQKGYPAEHFADATCVCGGRLFLLAVDENEGVAVRTCVTCRQEHPIGDSDEYMEDAELSECGCPCGADGLELTLGVALYAGSSDVRWLYIGARCPSCSMIGCYADWKNEFLGYEALLARA